MTEQRKLTLEKIILAMHSCSGEVGCTRTELATAAGIKKTPYFIGLLDFLVSSGWFVKNVHPTSPAKGWMYKPSQKLLDHWAQGTKG